MKDNISPAIAALQSSNAPDMADQPEIFAFSGRQKDDLGKQLSDVKREWLRQSDAAARKYLAERSRRNFSITDLYRLLIVLPSDQNPIEACDAAIDNLARQTENRWVEKNICYGQDALPGNIAFVFPGQGSQYTGMGRDLARAFPEAREALILSDHLFDRFPRLSEYIHPGSYQSEFEKNGSTASPEERLRSTDIAQPAIGAVSLGMLRILEKFNIRPDACCGHSFGELTALLSSERLDTDEFMSLAVARGKYMARAGDGKDRGAMLAVGAPMQDIEALLEPPDIDVILANRNSPDQGVLSGPTEAVNRIRTLCKERKIRATLLPVAAAFHSHLVKDAAEPFQKILESIEFRQGTIPIYSNTTALPYPVDPGEARRLLSAQLLNPVNFLDEIQNMYTNGIRVFIEVGPRNVLTRLVAAILKQRHDFYAIATDASSGRRSGLMDFAVAVCRLASLGFHVDLHQWRSFAPTGHLLNGLWGK